MCVWIQQLFFTIGLVTNESLVDAMIFVKDLDDCVIDIVFKAWKRLTLQQAMYVNVDCDEEKVEANNGEAQFGDGGGLAYFAFAPM